MPLQSIGMSPCQSFGTFYSSFKDLRMLCLLQALDMLIPLIHSKPPNYLEILIIS